MAQYLLDVSKPYVEDRSPGPLATGAELVRRLLGPASVHDKSALDINSDVLVYWLPWTQRLQG